MGRNGPWINADGYRQEIVCRLGKLPAHTCMKSNPMWCVKCIVLLISSQTVFCKSMCVLCYLYKQEYISLCGYKARTSTESLNCVFLLIKRCKHKFMYFKYWCVVHIYMVVTINLSNRRIFIRHGYTKYNINKTLHYIWRASSFKLKSYKPNIEAVISNLLHSFFKYAHTLSSDIEWYGSSTILRSLRHHVVMETSTSHFGAPPGAVGISPPLECRHPFVLD
jgi:hypothetical protein